MKTVAQQLSAYGQAVHNTRVDRPDLINMHEDTISKIMQGAPSGSGIDSGTKLLISNRKKLVFQADYHHMNDGGYYDGWTEHKITVTPAFSGFDLRISGRDRNQIKDYLYEVFDCWLSSECEA